MNTMNNMNLIHNIKNLGYKVRIRHYRTLIGKNGSVMGLTRYQRKNRECKQDIFDRGFQIGQFGGQTVAELTMPDGSMSVGEARVFHKDNYNYRLGTAIAVGRALKNSTRVVVLA